ncbi:hypothetical protein B0T19DRAFT_396677 [Cercophora scortea]|uniref:Uncharacterized protein n=1 Tax=Cercophora scortea TaxID=314031 RepID=A0AAE0J524_9PEZI|nr:hypothetical protein B0T19DRAFT_396677 [Cercophora scortea]
MLGTVPDNMLPPSPNAREGMQIQWEQTIEQTNEPIWFDVSGLLAAPPNDRDWMCCVVSAEQFELADSDWNQIKHFPGIYEVGLVKGEARWEDVSKPKEGESRVYGVQEAMRRAKSRYLRAAARGIRPRVNRGLDQYYRRYTLDPQLRVDIEWLIVLRDISESDREGLLEQERQSERHQVSLLRRLLEVAGGQADDQQHMFCEELSINDSFELFVNILDLKLVIAEPVSFGSFDARKMREALFRSKMAKGNDIEVILGEQLVRYIPSGFSDTDRRVLPAELIGDMELPEVLKFQIQKISIYCHVPSLKDREVDTLLLVCFLATSSDHTKGLKKWVISGRGYGFCQQTVESLLRSRTPELTVLAMTALLCYQGLRLQGRQNRYWAPRTPGSCSFLLDFGRLLRGGSVGNALYVLKNMTLSLKRAMGDNFHQVIRGYLHRAMAEESQQQLYLLVGVSGVYWCARLRYGYDHRDAWEEARRQELGLGN